MPAGSGPLPLQGPGGLWTGCQNPREHPAVSQTVLAPEGPWVEDGRASPVLALWGCCNKTPYTRRLVDGNVYFSGWKSGFLVPQIPGLARA